MSKQLLAVMSVPLSETAFNASTQAMASSFTNGSVNSITISTVAVSAHCAFIRYKRQGLALTLVICDEVLDCLDVLEVQLDRGTAQYFQSMFMRFLTVDSIDLDIGLEILVHMIVDLR